MSDEEIDKDSDDYRDLYTEEELDDMYEKSDKKDFSHANESMYDR